MPLASSAPIGLRAATDADRGFVAGLLRVIHAEPFAQLDEQQRETLVDIQVRAQEHQYELDWPDARHYIVTLDGLAVGRLLLHRGDDAWWLVDIALLPEYRDRGIGSTIIRRLIDDCAAARIPLRLSVALPNPARRLYRRLGFNPISVSASHELMEWRPARGGG